MSSKRILISAGGTGGHVYPAQGLAQQLSKQASSPSVLFVAGGLSSNKYFDRTLFSFKEVASSPLLFYNPIKSLKGLFHLVKGVCQSIKIMRHYRPQVVVGFGSYHTVPTLLAATLLRIPIVLHEANSIPGKANKWFAPLACKIGVHFPSTAALLKGRAVEVGMPLRDGYKLEQLGKKEALDYFQLSEDKAVLLIFGGSQGAQAINAIVKACLADIKKLSLQVVHLTGSTQVVDEFKELYASHGIVAKVKAFETHMHLAWRAADFFIGRSGASTIAEAVEFEVPGILIPYPYATDQHQDKNADFFIYPVGGGIKRQESDLTSAELAQLIKQYCQSCHLNALRKAIQAYKQRPNRLTLCEMVLNII